MRKILSTLVVFAVTLTACGSAGTAYTPPGPTTNQQWSSPPAMQIDTSKTYYATVETNLGTFDIELFANESPETVNNFVFLAKQGFYNNVIFHRILQTFMVQTGDPTGTGGGSPGYSIPDELPVKHNYDVGVVAMANTGRPISGGSQFFICTGPDAANLNRQPIYTQFGKVVSGMDVVQKIASVEVGPGNGPEISRPVQPPWIKNVQIANQ